jgi:hypothetical protein
MTYLPVGSTGSIMHIPQDTGMGDFFSDAINKVGSVIAGGTAAALSLAAPRFTEVSGVAKPNDEATLKLFKALQTQMNRVAKQKKLTVISVDGKIGSGSRTLMNGIIKAAAADVADMSSSEWKKAVSGSYGSGWDTVEGIRDKLSKLASYGAVSVSGIATNALGFLGSLKGYADYLSAPPAVASPKPASPPAVYNPTTQLDMPQPASASMLDAWGRLGTGVQVAAVAGLLGIGAFVVIKRRKK